MLQSGRLSSETPLVTQRVAEQNLNVRRTYSKLGRSLCMLPRGVPRFDSLDRVFEGPLQHAPPDRSEYETEHSSLQVLALPNDDHVNIGRAIWLTREGVGVARRPAPDVGVGRRQDDAVEIGPIVVQAFPNPARALRDVGSGVTPTIHLEVLIGAIAKKFRTTWSEFGEPSEVLLGRQRGSLMEVNRGHVLLLLTAFPMPPRGDLEDQRKRSA